jgi:hypothetical protein
MTPIHNHAFPLVHMQGKTGYAFPTWADHLHMCSVKQRNDHAFPLVHMHGKTEYTFPTWADHLHMCSVKQRNVHISAPFFFGCDNHTCESFETLYHKFNDFIENKPPKFSLK